MKLKDLKKELPFKWRVQSSNAHHCDMVGYIDARFAMDLLDEVVGAENWQTQFNTINGHVFCSVGIKVGEEWIWKSDVGKVTEIEAVKGEASDAFKRACVHWGIGRFTYALTMIQVPSVLYTNAKGKKTYQPTRTKGNSEQIFWDKDELSDYCMALHNGKASSKADKPPKTNKMLNKVVLGVETLLNCKVDRARVEELIRKNHDDKLPRTLEGVDKCIGELTVTGMKNILEKE